MAHASELLEQIHRLGLRFAEAPVRISYIGIFAGEGAKTLRAF